MTFKFRLEKILHFVKLRETVKKMEVSAILQRLRFMERQREELSTGIRDMLGKQSDMDFSWKYYQINKVVQDVKDLKVLDTSILHEQTALERKKRELATLFQRKRALESLREKKSKEFRVDQSHKQQRELDEIFQLSRGKRW